MDRTINGITNSASAVSITNKPDNYTSPENASTLANFFADKELSAEVIFQNGVERISAPCVMPMLRRVGLHLPIRKKTAILDMACGTGGVTKVIHELLKATDSQEYVTITCVDINTKVIEHLQKRIKSEGWPNTTAMAGDATSINLPSDTFDIVVVGLAISLMNPMMSAILEFQRVVKPGGVVAGTLLSREGAIDEIYEALSALPAPGLPWFRTSEEFVIWYGSGFVNRADFVAHLFNCAGYSEVNATYEEGWVRAADGEDFCQLCAGHIVCVPEALWSPALRAKHRKLLQETIRDGLDKKYGKRPFFFERTSVLVSGRKPL
ncbi:glandicoline B O-methyltransferase roqN [Colletotrichum spaethianum]|uniref:Glandicoline B O-methyltransferase roqN n=1 Tax=Colletotrichum spaethianum TaxID=700344 RepID=A0AA37PAP2_9PEZI|nr:glandicoline B O-methyltransferase roqN [Colletotrichum spaethianum]GKT48701.1 glandicoline B O-methyltransferase roqN [Colletotrichum spaethianum]